jgi:hypothetical protein
VTIVSCSCDACVAVDAEHRILNVDAPTGVYSRLRRERDAGVAATVVMTRSDKNAALKRIKKPERRENALDVRVFVLADDIVVQGIGAGSALG